jgi:cytochrome oxidase Cu insertion factor (SCO1/SenC/PrrC family)
MVREARPMQTATTASVQSEAEFAALVDAIAGDGARREQLTDLMRENHPIYDGRGTATIVRMRGWILLALARAGISDTALIYVLEELDTGVDAYLVAAAARALRSYPRPTEALAPFVMRALANIRYRDEPVSFETYGEYAIAPAGTSPVRELLVTLAWLGPQARCVQAELESLRAQSSRLSRNQRIDVERALQAIRGPVARDEPAMDSCCGTTSDGMRSMSSWPSHLRCDTERIASVKLQDHEGALTTFKDFFEGQPSIVVFFYTRCDNPMKCSLTIAKLAQLQRMLEAKGLAERIHTAAITYDPAFDLPERLRVYGQDRGVRMDDSHRMLRVSDGYDLLRGYFALGVNFVESLVNRHRIEVYILDAEGRIANCFERLHWDEEQVVARTVEMLDACGSSIQAQSAN